MAMIDYFSFVVFEIFFIQMSSLLIMSFMAQGQSFHQVLWKSVH